MRERETRRLLDRVEVAETYGVPKRFLETAAQRGKGPRFVRIGRLVRYRVQDIEDWIASQATDPGGET